MPVVTLNAEDFPDLLDDIRAVGASRRHGGSGVVATDMQAEADGVAESATAATCFFEAFYPPLTTVGPNTFVYDLLDEPGATPSRRMPPPTTPNGPWTTWSRTDRRSTS